MYTGYSLMVGLESNLWFKFQKVYNLNVFSLACRFSFVSIKNILIYAYFHRYNDWCQSIWMHFSCHFGVSKVLTQNTRPKLSSNLKLCRPQNRVCMQIIIYYCCWQRFFPSAIQCTMHIAHSAISPCLPVIQREP